MRALHWVWLWLPIGWFIAATMLVLSLLPSPPGPVGLLTDKQLHALAFACLTLWFAGIYLRRRYGFLALAMIAFGVLIEVAQMGVSRRVSEWGDILADGVGIAIGLLLAVAGLDRWCQWLEGKLRRTRQHDSS